MNLKSIIDNLMNDMNNKIKFIGVDVGGTKIDLEGFDTALNSIVKYEVKTKVNQGLKGFLTQLEALIQAQWHPGIKGIALAMPGLVTQQGVVMHTPHIPIKKPLKLKEYFEKKYQTPVHVVNDVNAFLAAEYQEKKLKSYQNIIAVMIGTGLGGAAIVNGAMIQGAHGYAGEFGHMIIRQDQKHATFEKNTSGTYVKATAKNKKTLLKQVGIGLSNLCSIFDPEVIVMGGSVYHYHLKADKTALKKIIQSYSLSGKSPQIVDGSSKTSVAKGAVLMGWPRTKK
ncbi:ROK family protein [Candidatus Peregrinibacteria bacterium]|nr:MAG: ROK family protein [Candidatus Peregrinibacteria bacterium]